MTNPYQPPPAPALKKQKPTVLRTLAKMSAFLALLCVWGIIRSPHEPPPADAAERAGFLVALVGVPGFFVVLAVIFFVADRRRKARQFDSSQNERAV